MMIYSLSNLSKTCRFEKSSGCKTCQALRYCSKKNDSNVCKSDYDILKLKSNADQESVRKAFLAMCKIYHPDSGNPEADTEKFQEIERAYRNLQMKFIRKRWDVPDANNNSENKVEAADVEQFDIKHTAPQHRTYLSFDGAGAGTPFQRQNQYMQMKASKAAEHVAEHKIRHLEQKGDSLTAQDRNLINKTKTRFGMERLVEDLIQESMCKGDFDNLTGAGKPLKEKPESPYVDFITHKMNEIMIDNGFTPEWITLRKEIDEDKSLLRDNIIKACSSPKGKEINSKIRLNLEESTRKLNKKIELFNLTVPIMNYQKFLFDLDSEIKTIKIPVNSNTSFEKTQPVKSSIESSIINLLGAIFR